LLAIGNDEADTTVPRSEAGKLACDFLQRVAKQGSMYTLPLDTQSTMCFEVLRINRQAAKVVKTMRKMPRPVQFSLTIQAFDIWRSPRDDYHVVYAFGDPERVDPVKLASLGRIVKGLTVWSKSVSDRIGCIDLCNPTRVNASLNLLTDSCPPVASLMLELAKLGWVRRDRNMIHDQDNPEKVYSTLNVMSNREYFMCVLSLGNVFALGLRAMPSGQPQSFYKCLLRGKLVAPALGNKEYTRILQDDPLLALGAGAVPALEDDDDSDVILEAICDMDEPNEIDELFRNQDSPEPDHADSEPSVAAESHAESDSDHILEADPVSGCVKDMPAHIAGARLRFECYHNIYERYFLNCVHHADCIKSRNCGAAQTSHFGEWEPIAFLAVWHTKGAHVPAGQHVEGVKPTLDEVREWLERNGKL
jgi:hypothetical protein